MDKRTVIYFVWMGFSGRYGQWRDGLYAAMKIIEKDYDVHYVEPWDEIPEDAIVLYWEAPCTINGKDGEHYKRIQNLPNKKALLFAGGPVLDYALQGFDHVFVESLINKDEMDMLGIPNSVAFGVNTQIFKPIKLAKIYDAMHQATSASWKRQWLMAEAFGSRSLLCGRFQETDPYPFDCSKELGAVVLDEQPAEEVARLINESHCVCNTSEYWGGGQRATLESLACGVPVICMYDSPKNREYIEESGAGIVCEPNAQSIREAFKLLTPEMGLKGAEYVRNKWTEQHYANALLVWINSVSQS